MKLFWLILACAIGYIAMALLTIFLMILIDRLDGISPQQCYSYDFYKYVLIGLFLWIIYFFIALMLLFTKYYKKWLIFAVETIVASKEKKGETNDN